MSHDRNTLPSHYDGSDAGRAEFSGSDRWEPDNDEAPPLDTWSDGPDSAWQASQPHPGRRRRKFVAEVDDTDFEKLPSPERRRRPVRAAIKFFMIALIGFGAAALWFNYGPALSATSTSEVDKTAEALSRLTDEQRKLAQAVSGLQQLVQDSFQKNATAREQDTQRLSAQAQALGADLDGLRAAIASATTRSPVAHAPKSAAVQPQKKERDRRSAPPPQAEAAPGNPAPEH